MGGKKLQQQQFRRKVFGHAHNNNNAHTTKVKNYSNNILKAQDEFLDIPSTHTHNINKSKEHNLSLGMNVYTHFQ